MAALIEESSTVLVLTLNCKIPAMVGVIGLLGKLKRSSLESGVTNLKVSGIVAWWRSRARNDTCRDRGGSNECQEEGSEGRDDGEHYDLVMNEIVEGMRVKEE